MKRTPKGRLELTWMGKDSALIPVEEGKYDYAWVDPDDPRAREVKSIEVLEQVGEVDGPAGANENLLIIGDSGDALRSLATIPEYHAKYAGQVKLVYIDPPFNTEKTFEHYADQLEHSIWLTMMRDRIRDLKPLLADDASVWVHLDDSEVHRMRVLLDEEFGYGGFVAQIAWRATDSSSNNAKSFARDHNTILVYSPMADWRPNFLPDADKQGHYKNPDDDPRGPWYDGRDVQNPKHRENLRYSIPTPDGGVIEPPANGWRWEWTTMQAKMASGEVYFNETFTALKRKTYLWEQQGLPPSDFWFNVEQTGSSRKAKNHLKELFPGVPTPALFDTPKPEALLYRILELASQPGDTVLDFFAGSGTTPAVSQKMGRRWIAVELQDSTARDFLVPRLLQVVGGLDSGGVTFGKDSVTLPGVSLKDAEVFKKVLASAEASLDGLNAETVAALKKAVRRIAGQQEWAGGGGFTVAKMGPSMYEVDDEDGDVYLSAEATNGAWSRAVAGQLEFTLTPEHPVFCGVRRRQRLAVIDGVVDETVVRTVVENLADNERAVIVGKGVVPEADALLRSLSPGSRIKKAPGDIFPKATVN